MFYRVCVTVGCGGVGGAGGGELCDVRGLNIFNAHEHLRQFAISL